MIQQSSIKNNFNHKYAYTVKKCVPKRKHTKSKKNLCRSHEKNLLDEIKIYLWYPIKRTLPRI